MVLYFSGTGNSRYIARKLAAALGDEIVDISSYTREKKGGEFSSEKPFVFVAPAYASYIPRVVEDFIAKSTFSGATNAYVLLTCGASFSRRGTVRHITPVLREKGLTMMGVQGFVMPENYITLFATPSAERAAQIVADAEKRVPPVADAIRDGKPLFTQSAPSFTVGITNPAFYKIFTKDKLYYATDACVSCGKCVAACPLSNVTLENGRPVWHGNCTQCMACISLCPKTAIEYGKKAKGKRRYYLP